jgi:hypothetical protein
LRKRNARRTDERREGRGDGREEREDTLVCDGRVLLVLACPSKGLETPLLFVCAKAIEAAAVMRFVGQV